MNLLRLFFAAAVAILLVACSSGSLAPEPATLPKVEDKQVLMRNWQQSLDKAVGGGRLQPVWWGDAIAAVSAERKIALLDAATGKMRWRADLPNLAAGGAGLSDNLIVAATIKGEVLAFGRDGKKLWQAAINSEVGAPPVIAGEMVLIRGSDGRLVGLAAKDGEQKWVYARPQPALQLRNFAPPVVADNVVFVGHAAGKLTALNLADGRVLWEAQVAQPRGASEIERVADVVSPPVFDKDQVCAVAYQGRLACFNILNGNLLWSRDVSSWSGLAADAKNVYVTDDKGHVMAYERSTGRSLWRQEKLQYRGLSGPALMGRTLAVGDFEGYVHFLDTEDGSFVAQRSTDGGAILTAPSTDGEHWLVQTQNGGLFMFGRK